MKSFLIPAVMMFNLELPTSDLAVPRHRVRKTKLFSISESSPPPALELMLLSLVNPKLFSTLASPLLSPRIAEQLLMVKIHVHVQLLMLYTNLNLFLFSFAVPFLPSTQVNYGGFLFWKYLLENIFFGGETG